MRELGRGGFGVVYLVYDTALGREDALKLFRRELKPDVETDREAVALAKLNHPGIVTVYDRGEHEGQLYFVSEYINGPTLKQRMQEERFTPSEAADLVAKICDAVQHAHEQGVILRDLKPSNILLKDGVTPILIDFGIALFEEDFGIDPFKYAGTVEYMSPEQTKGEGHLLDARSDVYSLGAIFYHLLAGHVPFTGTTVETVEGIRQEEALRPGLRQHGVPPQLEHISLKALSKLPTSRYQSAAEMAERLRNWEAETRDREQIEPSPPIVFQPPGLRPFDADNAEFFLNLLPGERDANGLPDSIRYWLHRIGKAADSFRTESRLRVGVLHGPSGTGKSSLLKAGIVPRLGPDVEPIFIEATADGIEQRLLSSLRHFDQKVVQDAELPATISSLSSVKLPQSVLIVVDQFEQWLRDWDGEDCELIDALRAVDGRHCQSILVVRDDFWSVISQFMKAVRCGLYQNANAMEMFEAPHARQVLSYFGQAYGAISEEPGEEQLKFVERAVEDFGKSSNKKTSPIQIALLAEVFKQRPWTITELNSIGGTRAVGRLFLEQSFEDLKAEVRHQYQASAAGNLLSLLLPKEDSNIRSAARSREELLEASDYEDEEQTFEHLIRILDSELRLITPVEADEKDEDRTVRYQLTHDFLVPAVREWLERQRSDTKRGRAQLRLERLASAWEADQDKRHVPGLYDFCRIKLLTRRSNWDESQHSLMRKGIKKALLRLAVLAVLIGTAVFLIAKGIEKSRAEEWLTELLSARIDQVPDLLVDERLDAQSPDRLTLMYEDALPGSAERLNVDLARLKVAPSRAVADRVFDALMASPPEQFAVVAPILLESNPEYVERSQTHLKSTGSGKLQALLTIHAGGGKVTDEEAQGAIDFLLDQPPKAVGSWSRRASDPTRLLQLLSNFKFKPTDDQNHERRVAMGAIARAVLGDEKYFFDTLNSDGIPVRRAFMINAIQPSGLEDEFLLDRLESGLLPIAHASSLVALDTFFPTEPSPRARRAYDSAFTSYDRYIRAAANYLSRRWSLTPDQDFLPFDEAQAEGANFYDTFHRTRMSIISAAPEQGVTHNFAIASTPITIRQFGDAVELGGLAKGRDDDLPVFDLKLSDALEYCNWLSLKEDLEPCYLYQSDSKMFEPVLGYENMTGYRLASSEEYRLAARGSTLESKVPAQFEELVRLYEWSRLNRVDFYQPSGMLRPNEFGLFDTRSNITEMILDQSDFDPEQPLRDRIKMLESAARQRRGSFDATPEIVADDNFGGGFPVTSDWPAASFRLVRTIPER